MSNRNTQGIEVGISGAFDKIKVFHLVRTRVAASATRHTQGGQLTRIHSCVLFLSLPFFTVTINKSW